MAFFAAGPTLVNALRAFGISPANVRRSHGLLAVRPANVAPHVFGGVENKKEWQ